MELFQSILMWVSAAGAAVLTVAFAVAFCHERRILPGWRLLWGFRRLPWYAQIILAAFTLQFIVFGSNKTNSPPMMSAMSGGTVVRPVPEAEDVVVPRFWNAHGVWDDTALFSFSDGWVFPWGTNRLRCVQVDSQGVLRPAWNATGEVASVGVPLAIVPGLSAFAWERTADGSYRVSWENGAANRDTNALVTAEIELFRNGDTCVITNGVAVFTPRVIPFPHVGIGQDDDWVRANFTNATDILAIGYENWVDAQVGVGLENGLYKFTANFTNAPPEATLLTVGDRSVCVTNAGEYVFIVEKGVEYAFGTEPYFDGVEYSMQDDVAPAAPIFTSWWWGGISAGVWTVDGGECWLDCPSSVNSGYCVWMPTFRGTPDVLHYGPSEMALVFTADISDYRYAQSVAYHWSSDDDNVVVCSPDAKETAVRFISFPSWKATSLRVTARLEMEVLESELQFTYGGNVQPQVHLNLSAPSALLLNSNREDAAKLGAMSLSFSSDAETNGLVRVSCVSGSDRLAAWDSPSKTSTVSLSREWDVDGFPGLTAWLEGVRTSEAVGDVRIRAEFVPNEGAPVSVERTLTVVRVGNVRLVGEPDDGLVVLRGTSVAFDVDVRPSGANLMLGSLFNVRRLRTDGTYTDWTLAVGIPGGTSAVYNPQEGGIYQIQALVGVGMGGVDERYYLWEEDEDCSIGPGRKGRLKAFGVCDEEWQKRLRNCAKVFLGSTAYLEHSYLPAEYGYAAYPAGEDIYKCNVFVAHRARQTGLVYPATHGMPRKYPPLANELSSTSTVISAWPLLGQGDCPQPGYIAATQGTPWGHCGIVDFDGRGISAGQKNVNRYMDAVSAQSRLRTYEGSENDQ